MHNLFPFIEVQCNSCIHHIVYIEQGNTLMSGTIRDNLLLANPVATDEQLTEALHVACADFVFSLPAGMDTKIGEHATRLSGGQAAWDAKTQEEYDENIEKDKANRSMQPKYTNEKGESLLMQCRHCIRYSLGYCVKRGGKKPSWREPLFLQLGDGRRFRLEFACNECQLNLYSEK